MHYNICLPDHQEKRQWATMVAARRAMRTARKYRVLFVYEQSEIVGMAANMAYVQGQSAIDADPEAAPSLSRWMELAEADNAPIVQETINTALAEAEDALSAISAGRIDRPRSYDVHVSPKRELVTEYIVGARTSDASLLHLQLAIRQYMIDSVLSRWATLTRPDAVSQWTAQAAADLEAVRDSGRRCMTCPETVKKFPAF